MKDIHPSFSVVIPTYQRRDLVCQAVLAADAMSYAGKVEIIVVIDGSTDGTAQALSALETSHPLKVIEQTNHGLAHARNTGAARSSCDILLFIDDDMTCSPALLDRLAESFAAGADAVVGEIPSIDDGPAGFLAEIIAGWAERSAQEARSLEKLTPFNIFGGQLSLRRSVFDAIGGFDAQYTAQGGYGKEDADIAVRLLENFIVTHNPQAITYHRYEIQPREYLRRGYELGRADVRFARRHFEHGQALLARNTRARPRLMWIVRAVSRIPFATFAANHSAVGAAWLISRTPLRSSPLFALFFNGVRQMNYWRGVRAAGGYPRPGRPIILCYHAIADHGDDPVLWNYSIPQEAFEEQIRSLQGRGYTFVTADEVLAFMEGRVRLPDRSVLLTFDDCYIDLIDIAKEVLAPNKIPALAFAVTGMATNSNEWDQKNGANHHDLLDWAAIRTLPSLGVTVGSHSRIHPDMRKLDAAELDQETRGSMEDFVSNGCPRPRYFAYPYGLENDAVRRAVEGAGYAAAFALAERSVDLGDDRLLVPRIEILRIDNLWRFRFKTSYPSAARILRWRLIIRWRLAKLKRWLTRLVCEPTRAGASA